MHHMLDHAREAVAMVQGKTRGDLDQDRKLNLSLVRLLEIVGEAANEFQKRNVAATRIYRGPEIVGLRNRLIHGYDEVDFDILWQIVKQDLPPLVKTLERILAEPNSDQQP